VYMLCWHEFAVLWASMMLKYSSWHLNSIQ
jgi:hypothetical protein